MLHKTSFDSYFFIVFSAVRCSKRNDLHRVCRGIAGDANLYTLFRVDGNPVQCPFGTDFGYKFSYNRGKGDCEWPESELEPCTETNKFVLNYQACPNVEGSELRSKLINMKLIDFKFNTVLIHFFNRFFRFFRFEKYT